MQLVTSAPARTANRETRINVVQGTSHVTDDPTVVMTTVLGSCVACCLFDPVAHIGGMNHFLLAEPRDSMSASSAEAERYGLFAMELLVNEMLSTGARRERLRAHLYGGANLHAGMKEIGTGNAEFAKSFLINDRIPLVYSHLGGTQARRVDFRATLGQARCRVVEADVHVAPRRPAMAGGGDVELF